MKKILGLIMILTLALCVFAFPAYAEEAMTDPPAAPAVTIDLTGIAQAIIALMAALVTTKLVPWIKTKTTQEQQKALNVMVDTLVFAAEQIYKTPGAGRTKLEYVQSQLMAKGYIIDLDAIEAAVRRMNTQGGIMIEGVIEPNKPPNVPGNPEE